MMQEYDPAALQAEYRQLAPGDPRMRAMRAACAAAERTGDTENALLFHHDLIKESVFSGDRYQALVDFPQYLALFKSDPQFAADPGLAAQTLWMFKWIVEAAAEFHQISKAQVLGWFSEFRRELNRGSWSLKPFYEKRAIFYSFYDTARLRLDFEDFLRSPHDAMSDGEADEQDTVVRWGLRLGRRDEAMKAAERIFTKNLHSDEIPATTYGYLLDDALRRGDSADAAHWAKLLRPCCAGRRMRLEQIGLLMCYDAANDPAAGLTFYVQNRHLRRDSRNPFLSFWFDRGAARLLKAAAGAGLTMPDEQGSLCTPESLSARADRLYADVRALAEKFDARNGSDFFTQNAGK